MKRFSGFLVLLPVALAGLLVVSTWDQVRFAAGADEGVYLHYASAVAERGPAEFRQLAGGYLARPQLAQYPPPFRLTTIGAQAAAVRLLGESFRSLQAVSLAAFLLLLVLLFFGFRNMFGESTAFWTTLLLSVSPLHLGLARRALSDSLVGALCVLCLWAFIRLLTSEKKSPVRSLGLAFLYAATFLAREGAVILVPISLALAGFHCVRKRKKPDFLMWAAVSVIPLALAVAAAALACGGLETLREVFAANFNSVRTNAYAQKYGSGPWYRYFLDFLLISPASTLLYLVWLVFLAGGRELDEKGWLWVLVPLLFLPLAAPITKNVRYALLLESPIRLGAVLLLQDLLGPSKQQGRSWGWMAAVIFLLVWADLDAFFRIFVAGGLYDPMTAFLLSARGFLLR